MVIDASNYPLLITTIGIGNYSNTVETFNLYKELDEAIPNRHYDNYHFSIFPYFKIYEKETIMIGDKNTKYTLGAEIFDEFI